MDKKFSAIIAFMLVCAAAIIFFGNIKAVNRAAAFAEEDSIAEVKTVYLTFDDGPSDRVTPKILDILQKENVKATFFIIGKQAETRKYILERERDEGHSIAVHTYSHEYHEIYSSPKNLLKDIDKCNDIIEEITGERSNLYRFPGGSYGLSDQLIEAVTGHGMRYIDWNASTRDAEIWNPTPDELYRAATESSADRKNVVLLAHDSTSKTTTAQALPQIIKYYKDKGYNFATF